MSQDREMARLIASQLGPDVLEAVENPIRPDAQTRSFGWTESMEIAHFAVECIGMAIAIWKARQDRALLTLALAETVENGDTRLATKIDPEKRLGVVAQVINAIIPDKFGASPSIPAIRERSKSDWLADWTGYKSGTRVMTQPILAPFADMDNWIVYKPIHWTPPPGSPVTLPRIVSVPAGFVSDLATIPQYFWWALPPSGKYGHAAILHDWLYWDQSCTRAVADRVFEVAMSELGVDPSLRKAMWAAVRVGGKQYWDEGTRLKQSGGAGRVLKRFPDTPVTWAQWRKTPDVFA
jgi:hypothetical protein